MAALYRGFDGGRDPRCVTIRGTHGGYALRARAVGANTADADDGDEARPLTSLMLPLPMRNRLGTLIVEALHDPDARHALGALAALCGDPMALVGEDGLPTAFPRGWFDDRGGGLHVMPGWNEHAAELAERAGRAWRALDGRPLHPQPAPLGAALDAAGLLFDARLYFEAHELLEPYWLRAEASDRDAVQGLIQVAVGFQHLANGNAAGARSLLREGSLRLLGRELGALALDPFARAIARCLDDVRRLGEAAPSSFDWSIVPRFPARSS
jgi:DUF309 family protein family protein